MLKHAGSVVLDLRTGPNNARNSEGAFLDMKDGRLMFAYSRYTGNSTDDHAEACVAARYSADKGNTWSEDVILARSEDHGTLQNIMSVSLLRMLDGDIGLFYVLRYGFHDTRLHLRRSTDEGETWSDPVCCVPGQGYYVTNNDRVVRLSSGRLVVPASFHRMKGDISDPSAFMSFFDFRAIVYFFLSDDDGLTWREAKNFSTLESANCWSGLQEPGIIELNNGVLWSWARTDLGRQYEMFSMDGGETWGAPQPSRFTSPCSPLSMKRMPHYGHLLAIWNPVPDYETRQTKEQFRLGSTYGLMAGGRAPLIGAISKDDGKTWGDHFLVETEEAGDCSYPAIFFTDEAVLLGYWVNAGARVRKINISEIIKE
ncbi:sialidase family protein [Paenibacillus eucommiae]|uniref:Sialidase domain-containing protein n=1 Tax=Paenibacillus eucommiae TaxID=1355755 RepID=A0ABS4ILM7_9BACL|nr:sialidase family protein [Paenibacillus eucommiae]MBP1988478.1 hypothetical protein [Paenibacillus eucommiae]